MQHKFVIGLAALASFATPVLASETTPEQVVIPNPPAGKAEVVFFRHPGFAGSAISCAPQENGSKISSLPPGRYAVLVTDPGPHAYSGGDNVKDGVALNLKPGSITYVQCAVRVGFWAGLPVFTVAHEEDFSTKLWKSLEKSRSGPNVLTEVQLKAALAEQAAVPPAAPTPTGAPVAAQTAAAPATPAPAQPAAVQSPVAPATTPATH